ncbi:hypothetical protein RBB75_04280 [Tunturibacter empetritectus]|uniref:Uncharacterized protein n=1 Tax=Tunturiibacter empetritectus TaxID=3069691 RepID=A0AAU7ZF57_9BACT
MNSPIRLFYRALLHLHPYSFRDRFGEEMLWIFDEQTREGRSFQLLFDVMRSLFVQHLDAQLHPQPQPSGFYSEISSTPPLRRIVHAAFLSIVAISTYTHLFGPQGPQPRLSHSPLVSSSRVHHSFTYWHLYRIDVNPAVYADLNISSSERSLSTRNPQSPDPR